MSVEGILATTMIVTAVPLLIAEFTIRAQVNRHLSSDQRISIHQLSSPAIWLGEDGLLARHKKFYPQSILANLFRLLWVLFFSCLVGLVIYGKTARR